MIENEENIKKEVFTMEKEFEKNLMELGLNVAYYRKLKGLKQTELAEIIGISRTHMSNIEATKMPTQVSVETLLKIARALDVDAAQLFQFGS